MSQDAVIATNRFGLGARPKEIDQASANPKAWLVHQLKKRPLVTFTPSLPHSDEILKKLAVFRQNKKMLGQNSNEQKAYIREVSRGLIVDGLEQALNSADSLNWRLLDFFSNHFSVSTSSRSLRILAPTLEREAIAANLHNRFEDLLIAVIQHPAMLLYLNNERSVGPNSRLGKKGRGLNENLAREILELHTIGVDGGYTQADVIELAKGISGWSLAKPKLNKVGFQFKRAGHEPGTRILLNKTFKPGNMEQGVAMLKSLANHPACAKFVCFKMAKHFVSDSPPRPLLEEMESAWIASQGKIISVVTSMLESKHAWLPNRQKFKTPREFVLSAFRATGAEEVPRKHWLYSLRTLGQLPFSAGSPAGFGDDKSDWNGATALMNRIDWAANFSGKYKRLSPRTILSQTLSNFVADSTRLPILRAQSSQDALTLLLMSPEFQWR